MVVTNNGKAQASIKPDYDRISELKAFDDSKAGVKAIADSGPLKIPPMFVHNHVNLDENSVFGDSVFSIPIIDFKGLHCDIVDSVRDACESWGFFRVINHGIPVKVMEEMIKGVCSFHEQDTEVKKQFYSRDNTRRFMYNSNFDLYQSAAASWRDTFYCVMAPHPPQLQELPSVCRDIIIEYSTHVMRLGLTLFEILSEALGLNPNHLKDMHCAEGLFLLGHYYPACPAPELTIGTSNHTDSGFLTILLQDQIGGFQVRYENHWVDVPPLPGSLIINIGDLLQLITNDQFKSNNHRVLAQKIGPRASLASFFRTHFDDGITSRVYGPIKELLSEETPPIYRQIFVKDYISLRYKNGICETSSLSPFKLHE